MNPVVSLWLKSIRLFLSNRSIFSSLIFIRFSTFLRTAHLYTLMFASGEITISGYVGNFPKVKFLNRCHPVVIYF